jgi:hypothetical protein
MGFCVEISGSYNCGCTAVQPSGSVVDNRGSPATAALARGETFQLLDLNDRVTCLVGAFHNVLEPYLKEHGPFDLTFVDGHHDGQGQWAIFDS